MDKLYLILFLLFHFLNPIYSQDLHFEKIGIEDGLPHYYTEYVFEDSKGYLWIGTVGGLVKFDGHKMKIFTTDDGLISNNIITINEDRENNIWIGTNMGIVKIKKNSIKSYILNENRQTTQQIFISSNNIIYAANQTGTYVYNARIDSFIPHKIMGKEYTRTIIEDNDGDIWFGGTFGLFKTQEDTVVEMLIPGKYSDYHNSIVSSLKDYSGNLWFGTASGFAKYENNEFKTFDQELGVEHIYIKLFQLQDSSFIFGTYGGGIVSFDSPEQYRRQYLGTDGITQNTVHGIEQTKGGTIWLATGSQLLKSKKQAFTKFNNWPNKEPLYPYEISKSHNNQYWFATNKGVVMFDIKDKIFKRINISNNQHENSIISIFADNKDNSIFFGTYSGVCFKYKNNKLGSFGNEEQMIEGQSIYGIYRDSKNNLWLSKNLKVLKCTDSTTTEFFLDSILNPVYEVVEDYAENLWFATEKGIFNLNKKNDIHHIRTIDHKNLEQIRQIEIDPAGNLWLGSTSNGIFKYDPKKKNGTHYTYKDGLTSNFIQSLKYDANLNCIWIGTINGITQIILNSNYNISNIKQFKNKGILDCNYNSIFCDKNDGVFFGIGDNLYIYNKNNDKPNKNKPIVKLEDIQLFNKNFDYLLFSNQLDNNNLPEKLTLPFNKNHLTFNFYAIEFNQPNEVTYSIKLEGIDNEWSLSKKENSITYNNLPPNSYIFKIKAMNSDGLWSETFEFPFIITPPFYKRYWFILLVISLVIYITYQIINNRIKKIKANADLQKNMAEMELKALRAQMNPHFIFNIMNNIQNLVLTEQPNKAIQLLGDFAKLIRGILDISSEKTIVLSKEIQFLKTYIELDLTQYPNKYDYQFSFSNEIDIDNVLIPPLLIQPFVENSIIHGLVHKNGKGQLNISFSQTKKTLICVVKDNGIGRKKSKEISIKKHNHESKALNISNDRINQFNQFEKSNQYNIQITDLIDKKGECLGTKVTITMPLILKY